MIDSNTQEKNVQSNEDENFSITISGNNQLVPIDESSKCICMISLLLFVSGWKIKTAQQSPSKHNPDESSMTERKLKKDQAIENKVKYNETNILKNRIKRFYIMNSQKLNQQRIQTLIKFHLEPVTHLRIQMKSLMIK